MRILCSARDLESQGCCLWYPLCKDFISPKIVSIKGQTFKKSFGIGSLRENTTEKMFWQASKAFHWVGDKTSRADRCVISEVVERLPIPNHHSHLPLFSRTETHSWCWCAMLYWNAHTSGRKGRRSKLKTWLVTTTYQGLCWAFHIYSVFKSNYLSYRGKKSISEKLNNLPKGVIQPVSGLRIQP